MPPMILPSFPSRARARLPLAAALAIVVALLLASAAPVSARMSDRQIRQTADAVDQYWSGVFTEQGFTYESPAVEIVDGTPRTSCEGDGSPPFYCGLEETIYLEPSILDGIASVYGDIVWTTAIAHEWGHHLTYLLVREAPDQVDVERFEREANIELAADCLAGVYIGARWYGFETKEGDITGAVEFLSIAGDPTHGTGDERIVAFMAGFVNGFAGCDLLA